MINPPYLKEKEILAKVEFNLIKHPDLHNVKVSVITPVYNVEDYLESTLDSLVNQTLDNIEIILVDDGSSDRSMSIILDYANKYKNIVVLGQQNAGPGTARNNGLEVARGEFISFVDSDDILPIDALEAMYSAAVNEEADIVIGASLSFNKKETWFIASHYNKGVYKPGEKTLVQNPELLYSLGPCNKLFRAKLVKNIRFPKDIKVTEDQPFVIEAYLKAKKIFTIDKIIYNYRSREVESNLSLSQKVRVDSVNVLKDIFKSLAISDELWNSLIPNKVAALETKIYYYNRIVAADIRPAIINAIKSKNTSVQEECFKLLLNWINNLDAYTFNKIPPLYQLLTYQIIDRYFSITMPARKIHIECLKVCFDKLDPGSLQRLETSSKIREVKAAYKAYKRQSTRPIWLYLVKRKVRKNKNKIAKSIRSAFFRRIVFKIMCLMPLQNKITFATNKFGTLTDSFKYIYEQILELRPGYKVVGHFRRKRKFKDYFKFYYDFATSRYVILDDYYKPFYNFKLRKGTEVIQTWHACGAFKKFGHSAVGYAESNTKDFENKAHQSYTKAVVTSSEVIPFYAEAFNMPAENIYPLGLARTDVFFNKEYEEYIRDRFYGTYPVLKNKKIITYAPTFRGGPGVRSNFKLQLDLKEMKKHLSDEYILVLKMHPSVKKYLTIPEELKDFVLDFSRNDISNVLLITDVLISDYSSIIFEFSLLEKPMIFYAYDLEKYLEDRNFYYNYNEFVPGPITKSTIEVIECIKDEKFDLEKVKQFRNRFFNELDGNASKRIVERLIMPLRE